MQGLLPLHASLGVMESNTLIGQWFRAYTALIIVSVQNDLSGFWVWSILFVISTMVRFTRSTTPFFLRGTWGRVLLLDTMIFQKMVKCLGNKFPTNSRPKCFNFVLRLCLYKCLELLELLKAIIFQFQHIKPRLPWKIINGSYKILCTAYRCSPHRATHIRMHNFQRLGRLFLSLVRNHNPVLFVFEASFTKQRGCKARKFAKVHTTYYVLECMNILHVQMGKVVLPKLKRAISHWKLYQVGHFRFVHLHKIDFVQIVFTSRNRNGYTIAKFDNAFV